jgi:hypothetical protein
MTRRLAAFLLGLSGVVARPLFAAEGPKQSIEVTSTERFDFLPGGTIRLENSYGFLTVEGWDEPEVEITVTKSTDRFYVPENKEQAGRLFDKVRVATERRSDKELAISTILPVRHGLFTAVLPSGSIVRTAPLLPFHKRGIGVEYTVHVPRDSRLIVHHDNGYVFVSDLTGGIEVDSHTGDITVMLPDPGAYSIDARTRVGSVTSDFAGKALNQFLLGTHFTFAGQAPARRIHLRMGRGSITIKNGPPSGPFWKN